MFVLLSVLVLFVVFRSVLVLCVVLLSVLVLCVVFVLLSVLVLFVVVLSVLVLCVVLLSVIVLPIETYLFYKNILYLTGEEYNSKMFLDCCGLVRQVVRDLASDFGFVIGPWNQAYMFDTLPKDVKEEDMKQGDLVLLN